MPLSHREVIQQVVEQVFTVGQVDAVDQLFHPDFVDHSLVHDALGGAGSHREGFKALVRAVREGLRPFEAKVDQVVVEGEFGALRNRAWGLHSGLFMGVPASGRRIEMTDFHFFRFQDGKIIEHWNQLNTLEVLQQLGAVQGAQ
jgi:steroid delta-isomerase-like uncharacterized protein